MATLFGGGKSPSFPRTDPIPTAADPAVKEAERLKREEEVRRRRGSMQSVLTSGMGVQGDAPTQTPALKPTLG